MSRLLGHPKAPESVRPEPMPDAVAPARRDPHRRTTVRLRAFIALLVAGAVAVVVLVSNPAVRQELRQSFSPVPSQYTELYFTRSPVIAGKTAIVPVSVVDHGGVERTHRLRVWLESPAGRITASTTTTLTPRADEPASTVARLPLHGDSGVVHVSLPDLDQTLHFRVGGGGPPASGGTP